MWRELDSISGKGPDPGRIQHIHQLVDCCCHNCFAGTGNSCHGEMIDACTHVYFLRLCRKEEKRQAINAAVERRAREDAEADALAAVNARRQQEENERRLKDADEKLRAQEEFLVWLQAEIKKNKKAKAAK